MTNLTLKITGLSVLILFSSQALASSPWANDTATNDTTTGDSATTDEPTSIEPVAQDINDNPVVEEVEQADSFQVEVKETPEPEAVTETTYQQGDVLNVNETTEVIGVKLLDFPRRGMTTDKVENELGRPAEIIPSIGQPPISRWIYDDRTVYFEYSSVIHVVAK